MEAFSRPYFIYGTLTGIMKIVTWNCNGAFRKKYEAISALDADIYIIQECEDPLQTKDQGYKDFSINHVWLGDSKNKGVGIFAKKEHSLKKLDWTNQFQDHTVKYFLPVLLNNSHQILGVWTHKNNSPNFGYIGQFWKYLQVNQTKFNNILIAGDFNSNVIWDQWDRWWNHSDIVKSLEKDNIFSLYHFHNKVKQGEESQPTFFLQRKLEKPYHIDYIFGSKNLKEKLKSIEIGTIEEWLEISDHLPIIATF